MLRFDVSSQGELESGLAQPARTPEPQGKPFPDQRGHPFPGINSGAGQWEQESPRAQEAGNPSLDARPPPETLATRTVSPKLARGLSLLCWRLWANPG